MKLRCDFVEARTDGSGEIAWDLWAIDDNGEIIPARHAIVLTPAAETQVALDGGASAMKELLVLYAPAGWDSVALDERVEANLESESVTLAIDSFVDGVGGYPVEFSLEVGGEVRSLYVPPAPAPEPEVEVIPEPEPEPEPEPVVVVMEIEPEPEPEPIVVATVIEEPEPMVIASGEPSVMDRIRKFFTS